MRGSEIRGPRLNPLRSSSAKNLTGQAEESEGRGEREDGPRLNSPQYDLPDLRGKLRSSSAKPRLNKSNRLVELGKN